MLAHLCLKYANDPGRHQPKVGGADLQIDRTDFLEQQIKPARRQSLRRVNVAAVVANGLHDVGAVLPAPNELRDKLGRMLQIGIEHDDRVGCAVIHSGHQRRLVAEAARHHENLYPGILLGQREELRLGSIRRRIKHVHDPNLVARAKLAQRLHELFVEGLDDLLFLKDRANDVDALHRGRIAVASYFPFSGIGTAEKAAKTLGWTWRNGNGLRPAIALLIAANAPVSSHRRAMKQFQVLRSAVERHAHRRGLGFDAFADAFVVAFGARADREKPAHDADHGTLVDQIGDPGDGDGNAASGSRTARSG